VATLAERLASRFPSLPGGRADSPRSVWSFWSTARWAFRELRGVISPMMKSTAQATAPTTTTIGVPAERTQRRPVVTLTAG
jgi:hypothetical protein